MGSWGTVLQVRDGNDTLDADAGTTLQEFSGNGNNLINLHGDKGRVQAGNGNNQIYADYQMDIPAAIAAAKDASATDPDVFSINFSSPNSTPIYNANDYTYSNSYGTHYAGLVIGVGNGNNTIVGGNGNGDAIITGVGNNTIVCGAGKSTVICGFDVTQALMPPNPDGSQMTVGEYMALYQLDTPAYAYSYDIRLASHVPTDLWGRSTERTVRGGRHRYLLRGNGDGQCPFERQQLAGCRGRRRHHCYGDGQQHIFAGAGNVTLWGWGGNNYIDLESGNDEVNLHGGNNIIIGGTGNSTIIDNENGNNYLPRW